MNLETKPSPQGLIAPPEFTPHWNESITDDQYHADRTSVGSTQIRQFIESNAGFHYEYFERDQDEIRPESNEFRLGKIVHMAILERERFNETYLVMPEFWGYTQKGERTNSMNCKEVREKKAEWMAGLQPGAKIVTRDELDLVTYIAEALMRHKNIPSMLKGAQPEVAGYFRDPETGILVRIKPDLIVDGGEVLIDFKTARSTKRQIFGGDAFKHRYDLQMFTYGEGTFNINGVRPKFLVNITMEKKRPIEPAVYHYTEEQLTQAEVDYRQALRDMKKAIEEDYWPFRQKEIEPIHVPYWFIDEATADMEMFNVEAEFDEKLKGE